MQEGKYVYHLQAGNTPPHGITLLLVDGSPQVLVVPLPVLRLSQESLLSQQVSVLLLEIREDVTVKTQLDSSLDHFHVSKNTFTHVFKRF